MTAEAIQLKPQPGAQERFLSTSADIALYGGAAGGGKTFAILLESLRHMNVKGFGATIFRRTSPQIRNEGGLWDESKKLFSPLGGDPAESVLKWKMPPHNNVVKFAHLDYEKDVQNFQGSQIPLIGFDELTHFSEKQFFYMMSRNRSTCGVRPYMRATTNPDSGSWVAGFISWWINQETGYPIHERSGVVRWFARIEDNIVWGSSKEELIEKYPAVLSEETPPKSFTFVAATLDDNQILMEKDPSYKANLMALPRVEREQLLHGNWKIKASAGDYFSMQDATIIDELPNDIVKVCRAWDLGATEPSVENPSPDSTSGVKLGIRKNKDVIVMDVKNKKINAAGVQKLITNTASMDGKKCKITLPQDPGQAGKSQAEMYVKLLAGYAVQAKPVSGSKEVRASLFAAQWQAGNVYLLKADWNEQYLEEMNAFPKGAHDDDVDASSDAYGEIASGSGYNLGAFK